MMYAVKHAPYTEGALIYSCRTRVEQPETMVVPVKKSIQLTIFPEQPEVVSPIHLG